MIKHWKHLETALKVIVQGFLSHSKYTSLILSTVVGKGTAPISAWADTALWDRTTHSQTQIKR